mmetsp:Transcript_47430/g.143591  ORF Transcript_47430/g.143591 Transcript_47430/m.143591 type:complete len:92 (-) Transcript_47430:633-908(-)
MCRLQELYIGYFTLPDWCWNYCHNQEYAYSVNSRPSKLDAKKAIIGWIICSGRSMGASSVVGELGKCPKRICSADNKNGLIAICLLRDMIY